MIKLRELLNKKEMDYLAIKTVKEVIDFDKKVADLTVLELSLISSVLLKSEDDELKEFGNPQHPIVISAGLQTLFRRALIKNLSIF